MKTAKISIKAELVNGESKLTKVIRFDNNVVEIPVNKDGSIKWFDDSQLVRNK